MVHVDTIRFAEVLTLKAPPDEAFNEAVKTEIARCQLIDHASGHQVPCAKCREPFRITSLYRCFYCAVFYCRKCGAEHFATTNPQHQKAAT